jgi:F-type H+-transporting ATPase subunit b
MPQLAVDTYFSQIFWLLSGFLIVYVFVANIISPKITETLKQRVSYIDDLLKSAEKLKIEAEKISSESSALLRDAEASSVIEENKIVTSLKKQSEAKKNELHGVFLEKSRSESELLAKSVANSYKEISCNMDDILDIAMEKISPVTGSGDK